MFYGRTEMQVKWKSGVRFKTPAEVAHEQIDNLRKRNGGKVTARQVVDAAKVKRNPLHRDFEWDDTKAADEFRLNRARTMMNSLVIVRDDIKTERPQRVYEVVKDPKSPPQSSKKVYKTVDDIMKDPDNRAELLGRALRELISIRNRYRDLQELAVVMRSIDELIETVEV